MRVAWFSPVPPVRSGVAAYTAEVAPLLRQSFELDVYHASNAHEFLYANRRAPYDVTVYQLGNAPAHDYIWGYLARYPGVVVLHDARLHHARARMLLSAGRTNDYRDEFRYSEPDVPAGAAEYAVEGLGGLVHYLWPMLRVPVAVSRAVVVHNAFVARELRRAWPHARIETIRMGVPRPAHDGDARAVRQRFGITGEDVVFATFGRVTREKRIDAAVRALAQLGGRAPRTHLLVVGEEDGTGAVARSVELANIGDRVHVTGFVPDDQIGCYLAAADACLCLRWPTALETSASWLRCIAAGRPTIVSDLPHLDEIPSSVALRIDLLDEDRALVNAMRALATDPTLRARLGDAGHEHWAAHHMLTMMADDYARLLQAGASWPPPAPTDLPRHIVDDRVGAARALAQPFGVNVDVLTRG